MLIGGLQKTTLLDYPDKVASTVFTIGCNYRCSYCHNPDIVKGVAGVISMEEIMKFLNSRKKVLDAVCITGGEPTIHNDLPDFIAKLKKMNLLVKLDTNGTNPKMLSDLIKNGLIDYVAMDIKAPWDKYQKVVCRKVNTEDLKKTIKTVIDSGVDHEFRSTVLPTLHSKEDIIQMAKQVKGAKKYYLQQFRVASDLVSSEFTDKKPFTKKQMREIISEFKSWFKDCNLR